MAEGLKGLVAHGQQCGMVDVYQSASLIFFSPCFEMLSNFCRFFLFHFF